LTSVEAALAAAVTPQERWSDGRWFHHMRFLRGRPDSDPQPPDREGEEN
jgi:hypothetical protein